MRAISLQRREPRAAQRRAAAPAARSEPAHWTPLGFASLRASLAGERRRIA